MPETLTAAPSSTTIRDLVTVRSGPVAAKAALIAASIGLSLVLGGLGFAAASGWLTVACLVGAIVAAVWAQHAAAEEVHDGVHGRLARAATRNSFWSGSYCSLIGISFSGFKAEHLNHHLHFGDPLDPDYDKYAVLPRGWSGWARYLLLNFTGYTAVRRALSGRNIRTEGSWQHPLGTAALQLGLWAVSAAVVHPLWYPVCWLLPLTTVTYGLTQFRTLLEHYCDPASPYANKDGRAGAIYDLGGLFQAQVFAAQFGYNYHGTHHCLPSVPNYALHRVEELGADQRPEATTTIIRTTYAHRLAEIFRLSMNPRS